MLDTTEFAEEKIYIDITYLFTADIIILFSYFQHIKTT